MIQALIGAATVSREVWEAHWDGAPEELTDERVVIENLFNSVRRQGSLAVDLALDPRTQAELETECARAIERLPIWLEAKVFGPPITSEKEFLRNVAELVGFHRRAILRVAREQVEAAGQIERILDEAPAPDPAAAEIGPALSHAISANARALVLIARDLDER